MLSGETSVVNLLMQGISMVGAGLILCAFFGLQRGWWRSDARGYLWVNLVGAMLLAVVAVWDRRVGFVLLEGAWAGVSATSLVRTLPDRP